MANKRNLKKDINFYASEIITECYAYSIFFPEIEKSALDAIMEEAWEMRKRLIHSVNHAPDGSDIKAVKAHFTTIVNELLAKSNDMLERLNKLHKK